MLLNRCVRFYSAIDHLNTIFRLLHKRDELLAKMLDDMVETEKSQRLNERILCAIKAFLIEHTMMPVSFNFGGEDILYELRNPLHKSH